MTRRTALAGAIAAVLSITGAARAADPPPKPPGTETPPTPPPKAKQPERPHKFLPRPLPGRTYPPEAPAMRGCPRRLEIE